MPTYAYAPTSYSWQRKKNENNAHPASRASSDSPSLPMAHSPSSLSPPRPSFHTGESNRTSLSSLESRSTDPASDFSRELPLSKAQNARTTMTKPAVKPVQAIPPPTPTTPMSATITPSRASTAPRRRSRSSQGSVVSPVPIKPATPSAFASSSAPTTESWSPVPLYNEQQARRPPPSSFAFPFQAYPGNPDPGTTIPGVSRRSSQESLRLMHRTSSIPNFDNVQILQERSRSNSWTYTNGPPDNSFNNQTPFGSYSGPSMMHFRHNSASAAMTAPSTPAPSIDEHSTHGSLPRRNSTPNFRAPFLSPASRPSSSLWAPPTYRNMTPHMTPNASTAALSLTLPKSKPPLPSTRLPTKLAKEDKPWLMQKDGEERVSWWLTCLLMMAGVIGAALMCWSGWKGVPKLQDSQLCLVMDDNFDALDLDNNWTREVELGGFGNGEFQMTTTSSNNLYTSNSNLYIVPTLTSNEIGADQIFNGGNYTLEGCTTDNSTACTASSDSQRGSVINPVQSARINTRGKKNIAFGKVEVRAKLPQGDWLWPAIWMLPESQAYGEWPASGEIDIMEARGNSPSYEAQGTNYVRASLNYGPMTSLLHMIYGWYSSKRTPFSSDFHTYSLEWTGDFMRFYTDSRLHAMLDLRLTKNKESFWSRGGFPKTIQNGSTEAVVQDPYSGRGYAAPFDQSFYLILDLAVGGTSGWFPDNVGNKPWYDGSTTAMRDFARNQDKWSSTWPENVDDRAFRIDYVKMWKLC